MDLDNPHSLLSLALHESEGVKMKVYLAFSFTVNPVTLMIRWHLGIRQLRQQTRKIRLSCLSLSPV